MSEASARHAVYLRSGGTCEICGQRPGTNFHHRRSAGRVWSAANGLHLCGSGTTGCHGWVTEHPAISRKLGWIVTNYVGEHAVASTPALVRGKWMLLGQAVPLDLPIPVSLPRFVPVVTPRA